VQVGAPEKLFEPPKGYEKVDSYEKLSKSSSGDSGILKPEARLSARPA
jgi:hypothetical protein